MGDPAQRRKIPSFCRRRSACRSRPQLEPPAEIHLCVAGHLDLELIVGVVWSYGHSLDFHDLSQSPISELRQPHRQSFRDPLSG